MTTATGQAPLSPQDSFPFSLSFVGGQAVLMLAGPRCAGPVRLEVLEMEVPDLRFPVDLSAGVYGFRHRRCQLLRAKLTLEESQVQRWLTERVSQAAFGYRDLTLRFGQGFFELDGEVALGEQAARFFFRGVLQTRDGRSLQLGLDDLRLYGTFPVPAPLLAAGLLKAAGADPAGAQGARLEGCSNVVFDLLGTVLLRSMPSAGWRLPAKRSIRLAAISLQPGRLVLEFATDRVALLPDSTASARVRRLFSLQQAKAECRASEECILVDGPRVAADRYRDQLARSPGDPFASERILQLLAAEADDDEETLRLAEAMLAGDPRSAAALWTSAAVLARQERSAQAGERYRRLADLAAVEGDTSEEIAASLAAGRCLLAVDRTQARLEFERVIQIDANHEAALTALAPLYAESGCWRQLIELRLHQVSRAGAPEARLHSHLALAELYRVHVSDPQHAREHYELALAIDPHWEPALRGLAEACIEAEELIDAVHALERLGNLVAERQDLDAELSVHLRIASLWEHLGDPQATLSHLQHGLALRPGDPQALRRAAGVLISLDRHKEGGDLLRRLIPITTDPAARLELHQQLAAVSLHLGQQDEARQHLDLALAIDQRDLPTLELRLALAQQSGNHDELISVLGLVTDAEPDEARRAALLLQQGQLQLARSGGLAEAAETLERAAEQAADAGYAAYRELASAHARAEDWVNARRFAELAAKSPLGQEDAGTWRGLAQACLHLNDLARAGEGVRWAMERDGADAAGRRASLLILAEVLELQNDDAGLAEVLRQLEAQACPEEEPRLKRQRLSRLGALLHKLGDPAAAVDSLERGLSLAPDDPELLEQLATVQEDQGHWEAAREALQQVLRLRLPDPSAAERCALLAVRIATASEQLGHLREALESYRRALEYGLPPFESDRAWSRIVDLHLERQDPSAAARAAESWAAITTHQEKRADRLYSAGQIWLKRAMQPDPAIRCFRAALEQRPNHAGALDALESIWSERGDRDSLLTVLRQKVEATSKRPAIQKALLARLGEVLAQVDRREEARAAFSGALSLDADYLPALLFLARDAVAAEEFERAEIYFRRLLVSVSQLDPAPADRAALQVEIYLYLASLAHRRVQPQEEEGHLEMALAVDPHHPEALERLDRLLGEQKRVPELLEVIRRRLDLAPDLDAVLALEARRAGLLETQPGRRDEAIASYRQILFLSPEHELAMARLTELFRETRQFPELVDILERQAALWAPQTDDKRQAARDALREAAQVALQRLEQAHRAMDLLRRALALAPEDASLLSSLLELHGEESDSEEVDDLLTRLIALSSDPQRRAALELRLARHREQRGETDAALRLLQQAIGEGRGNLEMLETAARLREGSGAWAEAAEAYRQLGQAARAAGETELALRGGRRLLEIISRHSPDSSRAESVCREILELDPTDTDAATTLANLCQRREDWPALIAVLRPLLKQARASFVSAEEEFQLATRLALAHSASGDNAQAGELLESALGLALSRRELLWSLAVLARDLGVPAVELRALAALAQESPRDPEMHLRMAELYWRAADVKNAGRALVQGLEHLEAGPRRAEAARDLLAVLEAGNLDDETDSLILALQVLRQEGPAPADLLRLADLLRCQNRCAEALAVIAEVPAPACSESSVREVRWSLLRHCGHFRELAEEQDAWAGKCSDPVLRAKTLLSAARIWAETVADPARAEASATAAAASVPGDRATLEQVTLLLAGLRTATQGQAPAPTQSRPQVKGEPQAQTPAPPTPQSPGPAMGLTEGDWQTQSTDQPLAAFLLRQADSVGDLDQRVDTLLHGVELLGTRLCRPRDALELLRRAQELRPESPEVLRAAADVHQALGDLVAAEAALVGLADAGQDADQALDRAAGLAHLRADAATEARYLVKLARLRPRDGCLSLRLAAAYRASGDLRGLCSVLEERAVQDDESLLEMAKLCAGPLGDLAAACDAYQRFLSRQPDHRDALQAMVGICDALGNAEEATSWVRRFRDLLPAGQRRHAVTMDLAQREESLAHYDRAAAVWREALESAPQSATIVTHLAEDLARLEQWKSLCVLLEETLATGEMEPELRSRLCTMLGEVYLDHLDDATAGLQWLAHACSFSVRNEAAFTRLMSEYRMRQSFPEGAEALRQRIRQLEGQDRSSLWRELGYLLEMRLKDLHGAALAYAAAYREEPGADPRGALHAQELFLRAGDPDAALSLLDEVIGRAADASRPPLLAARARVLVVKGMNPLAVEEYERALDLDPAFTQARAELGRLRFGQGYFGAALPHLQGAAAALEDGREAAGCAFLAARALEKLGLAEEAISWYERTAARDPTSRSAYEALVPLYEARGSWEKLVGALAALSALAAERPVRVGVLCRLAAVQHRLGQLAAAEESYHQALTIDPDLPDALTALRQLAVDRGDWRRAAEHLAREIELCRDGRDRARLHRELGSILAERLSEAAAGMHELTLALELEPSDHQAALLLVQLLEAFGRSAEAARTAETCATHAASREERRELLLRAAAGFDAAGLPEDAHRVRRELRPTLELSRVPGPGESAPPKTGEELAPAAARELIPAALSASGGPPVPLQISVEGDDWPALVQTCRARAASSGVTALERAELLLMAARTMEEKLSRPLDAIGLYEDALTAAPGYLPAVEGLADAVYRDQDWHRARDLYDQLWQHQEHQARTETCYRRALIYETLGDENTADECYARAIAVSPKHRTALEGRARLALFRDDPGVAIQALTELERLITIDELEVLADVRQRLGKLHLRQSNFKAAKECLESVLAIDSKRVKALQSLLTVAQCLGDHVAMLDYLKQLISLTPDPLIRASLLHHRAEILGTQLDNEEAAVDDLLRAYDLAPNYLPTLWRLIDYYWEQGDLASVAEMGEHLIAAITPEEDIPDLRHVRLAVAAAVVQHDAERADRLLRAALVRDDLLEPALLELGRGISLGASATQLMELVLRRRPADEVRGAVHRLVEEHASPAGLPELLAALPEQGPAT